MAAAHRAGAKDVRWHNTADWAGWRRARDRASKSAARDRLVRRMTKGGRPVRMEVDLQWRRAEFQRGSALLMMLAEKVRLFERVSKCFTNHCDPSKVAHPLVVLLGQRISDLALGCEDLNDHDDLRRDRALSTLSIA